MFNNIQGTLPFMSFELLLGNAGVEHTEKHDLESFFYLLLYICTMYDGHKHVGYSVDWDSRHPFGNWIKTATMRDIAASKTLILGGFDKDFYHVCPYFTPLIPLLRKFRDAVFPPEAQNQRILKSPSATHAKILHILRECFNELPNEDTHGVHPVSPSQPRTRRTDTGKCEAGEEAVCVGQEKADDPREEKNCVVPEKI
jgi:hypothetical protein